jgi:hypothetical protein
MLENSLLEAELLRRAILRHRAARLLAFDAEDERFDVLADRSTGVAVAARGGEERLEATFLVGVVSSSISRSIFSVNAWPNEYGTNRGNPVSPGSPSNQATGSPDSLRALRAASIESCNTWIASTPCTQSRPELGTPWISTGQAHSRFAFCTGLPMVTVTVRPGSPTTLRWRSARGSMGKSSDIARKLATTSGKVSSGRALRGCHSP